MKWSIEEEEDRKRVQMTRRRFLFLGAAAAGAAITKKLMPATTTYRTYLAGEDAIVSTPGLRTATGIQGMLTTYYDRAFLANLKVNTPFLELCRVLEMPETQETLRARGMAVNQVALQKFQKELLYV